MGRLAPLKFEMRRLSSEWTPSHLHLVRQPDELKGSYNPLTMPSPNYFDTRALDIRDKNSSQLTVW